MDERQKILQIKEKLNDPGAVSTISDQPLRVLIKILCLFQDHGQFQCNGSTGSRAKNPI
jgi:hypothetical protein